MSKIVRVATTQYQVGNNVQENLQTLLSYIDRAADGGAQLVVTPEFGNHTSFYADSDYAWNIAIDMDGDYINAVKAKAKARGIHVVFNASRRDVEKKQLHITNFLVGPDGELIGYDDKQTLMGGEAEHLTGSDHENRIFETAIGRIGMMSCLDGVPPETARSLAVQGAQIITNAHNSCALDEPYCHIPVRAAENNVWVIAAGKVGPVCVPEMVEPLAGMVGIPSHLITALGENAVFDTAGAIEAQLPSLEAGIIFADIDITASDNKAWADGDLMADRRPELYGALVEDPVEFTEPPKPKLVGAVVNVRADRKVEENRLRPLDLLADAADNDAQLVVLPELCSLQVEQVLADPQAALAHSKVFETMLSAACKASGVYACTTIVTEDNGLRHTAILINDQGERIGAMYQTHLRKSFKAVFKAGDELPVFDTPLGRIGLMVGYDALFPEVASVLARKGAEIILHPTTWHFEWEVRLAVPERAAENRVSILSSARMDSPHSRGSLITPLNKSTPLRARDLNPIWPVEAPFDHEGHIEVIIHPERSRNKDLIGFDMQKGRRKELYGPLVR